MPVTLQKTSTANRIRDPIYPVCHKTHYLKAINNVSRPLSLPKSFLCRKGSSRTRWLPLPPPPRVAWGGERQGSIAEEGCLSPGLREPCPVVSLCQKGSSRTHRLFRRSLVGEPICMERSLWPCHIVSPCRESLL